MYAAQWLFLFTSLLEETNIKEGLDARVRTH